MTRTVQIQTPFGKDVLFVSLQGFEGLSELYEYNLTLSSKNPNLDAAAIIGQRATVLVDTNAGVRPLNGLVTDLRLPTRRPGRAQLPPLHHDPTP